MAGQKPRKGWIYFINSHQVILTCNEKHTYLYNLTEPDIVECQHPNCQLKINSSRVFRGSHPYIIWMKDEFKDTYNDVKTFIAIPLTSSEREKGLPTAYPINATQRNNLDKNSIALIHQICTIDENCFKDKEGNWLTRIGQLDKSDKNEIEKRLKYILDLKDNPNEDWFIKNAHPELIKKAFFTLPENQQTATLEKLLDQYKAE